MLIRYLSVLIGLKQRKRIRFILRIIRCSRAGATHTRICIVSVKAVAPYLCVFEYDDTTNELGDELMRAMHCTKASVPEIL